VEEIREEDVVQIMTNIAENNKVVDAMLMEKYFVYKTAL
jgi:hypothetical protein